MTPSNRLEALRQWTTVVADTGDIDEITRLKPTEATTNPSLILKAARTTRGEAILAAARCANESPRLRIDRVITDFGKAILEHIPGRVSTEVDARLSFDTRATVEKARRLIALYEASGISRERVLIKIAATWEGCEAAQVLEQEGIHCNMTLSSASRRPKLQLRRAPPSSVPSSAAFMTGRKKRPATYGMKLKTRASRIRGYSPSPTSTAP